MFLCVVFGFCFVAIYVYACLGVFVCVVCDVGCRERLLR